MKEYFNNIWLSIWTALVGMKITLKHLFGKKVTMQYPDKFNPIASGKMPLNSRNRIIVDMDECDGCQACVRACPVTCISLDIVKVTPGDSAPIIKSTGKPRKTWVTKYDIDFGICCFCSLCTDACPTDAIEMTREFEYSTYDKKDLIYHFTPLSTEESAAKKKMWTDYMAAKKKAEADAAADAAAAATPTE